MLLKAGKIYPTEDHMPTHKKSPYTAASRYGTTVHIRLDHLTARRVKQQAKREGRTGAAMLRRLVEQAVAWYVVENPTSP